MDTTLGLWLTGALIGLLFAMLIVVRISRRLDRTGRTPAALKIPSALTISGISEQIGAAKWLATRYAASKAKDGDGADKTAKAGKAVSAGVAIAIAMSVGGAVLAAVSKGGGHRPPEGAIPMPIEMAAGALHGTLLSPDEGAPVVLIVPGSGPTDRDGNSAAGLKTDAYKKLAEGLWREGIATVRVDKHGMYGSAGAGDPNVVTPEIYAADYRAWIDAIKAETGKRCVFLLGHSEGALMVSLAAQGRKDVCGLILVAGIGRPMGEVIRAQMRASPANAPLLPDAMRALDELEAGRHVDVSAMHPALQQVFAPAVQDYLISVLTIDPVDAVRRAGRQTLVVQGKNDLQVSVEDANLLNKAPKTKMRLIDGMNHVLVSAPLDRAANLATYEDPTLPLAPKLLSRIEDFIDDED